MFGGLVRPRPEVALLLRDQGSSPTSGHGYGRGDHAPIRRTMDRQSARRWLTAALPLASAALYYAWLASDSRQAAACGAFRLTYGFIPFMAFPGVAAGLAAIVERRDWRRSITLVLGATLLAVIAVAFVWLYWFGNHHCGD